MAAFRPARVYPKGTGDAAAHQPVIRSFVGGFLQRGAGPSTALKVDFIDRHKDEHGVQPICNALPEIARLGRTLRKWKDAFLAYWNTDCSNNGGTEAINGLIELHRRLVRGYRNRDNYRLRMLLIAGGLIT